MTKLNWLDWIAVILLIVGGLNWGLTALNFNLVETVFGAGSAPTTIVYILVGLSAIWVIFLSAKIEKRAKAM